MNFEMPRIIIAGLSGGSGKTMISTGLARALSRKGLKVQAFKKGPDYIDTLWLSLATGYPPRNLDPFMIEPGILPHLFENACKANPSLPDIAIIEGNRGLFDGQDLQGSCSTASLARQLEAPVLLAMNTTKMTRTAAALALGCKNFEPDVNIAGVILNQATRSRHRNLVKEAVEKLAALPVLGVLPRLSEAPFDERYSGLYGDDAALATAAAYARLDKIADFIEEHINLEQVVHIARSAPALKVATRPSAWQQPLQIATHGRRPRIGYVRDSVLWFYYTENLEALRRAGAELIELSLLGSQKWPEIDALYMGGGFPDDFAAQLAENNERKRELAALISSGLPVYAEGTGFYYLAKSISAAGCKYPMSGVFDMDIVISKVPQGIGYVEAHIEKTNPFFKTGTIVKAHEFHYTNIGLKPELAAETIMHMQKGSGLIWKKGQTGRDGLLKYNCFIAHTQLFAPGAPEWAANFVNAAATWAGNNKCGKITAKF